MRTPEKEKCHFAPYFPAALTCQHRETHYSKLTKCGKIRAPLPAFYCHRGASARKKEKRRWMLAMQKQHREAKKKVPDFRRERAWRCTDKKTASEYEIFWQNAHRMCYSCGSVKNRGMEISSRRHTQEIKQKLPYRKWGQMQNRDISKKCTYWFLHCCSCHAIQYANM